MSFFEYPHTRTYDNDLGWLIKHVNEMAIQLDGFIKLNTIKYADPIEWNITTQYESNTIVVDRDGTAYLSVAPVPSGVSLTNTDYWTPIFNYGENMNTLKEQIAAFNEEYNVTASEAVTEGEYLWFNGLLYKALYSFPAGTAYIPGTNIEKITIEEEMELLRTVLVDLASKPFQKRYALNADMIADDTLVTGDICRVLGKYAVNDGFSYNYYVTDNPPANSYSLTLSNGLKAVRISENVITPEMFGAVGDGVTDDTDAFVMALAMQRPILLPLNYYISRTLTIDYAGCRISGIAHGLYNKTRIYFDASAGVLFDMKRAGFEFRCFEIYPVDQTDNHNGIAIKYENIDGVDNCDSAIEDMSITLMNTCCDIKGRNFKATNVIFSSSITGIIQRASTEGETRDIVIDNCRFHGMCRGTGSDTSDYNGNYCIHLASGTNNRNKICNSYIDGSGGIITGSLAGLMFCNNMIADCWSADAVINAESDGTIPFKISGNSFRSRNQHYQYADVDLWMNLRGYGEVSDNFIDGGIGDCIHIEYGNVIFKNNIISNLFTNSRIAFYFMNTAAGEVSGNTLSDCPDTTLPAFVTGTEPIRMGRNTGFKRACVGPVAPYPDLVTQTFSAASFECEAPRVVFYMSQSVFVFDCIEGKQTRIIETQSAGSFQGMQLGISVNFTRPANGKLMCTVEDQFYISTSGQYNGGQSYITGYSLLYN